MAKWAYTLEDNGKALREAIENENSGDVIRYMRKCYKEITEHFENNEDYETLISDIEEEIQLTEGEDILCDNEDLEQIEEFGFESIEELVNERLYTFWNILDGYKIFCAL